MDLGIAGRSAIVAAASRGLGRACAEVLAAEGVDLVICARSPEPLEAAAAAIRAEHGVDCVPVAADVRDAEEIERVVAAARERFGTTDILITNAGGPPPGAFMDLSDEDFYETFDLTFMSMVRFCRAVLPEMVAQQWGRIVHIASITVRQPVNHLTLSNTVRLGTVGLAKTLANRYAADNVLVNTVCPGSIYTDRVASLLEAEAEREGIPLAEARRSRTETIPMKRLGEPEELASVAALLASERAGFTTGAVITVDGGTVRSVM